MFVSSLRIVVCRISSGCLMAGLFYLSSPSLLLDGSTFFFDISPVSCLLVLHVVLRYALMVGFNGTFMCVACAVIVGGDVAIVNQFVI